MDSSRLVPEKLVTAAGSGDCQTVQEILNAYPSQVDVEYSGKTAMQMAISSGRTEVMKVLIRYGADLNHSDFCFSTLLHHAVRENQPEAVLLLLQCGANWKEADSMGKTAPQTAYEAKQNECLKIFSEWDQAIEFKTASSKKQELSEENKLEKTDHDSFCTENKVDDKKVTDSAEEHESTHEKCKYCETGIATVQFEPCECVVSCFECCLQYQVCKCGAPIEKRSLPEDSLSLKSYIEGIKCMKAEISDKKDVIHTLEERVEKLEEYLTCPICKDLPVKCTLSCGHVFCVPCVKKMKEGVFRQNPSCGYCYGDRGQRFPQPDPKCPICKCVSIYTVLYPGWDHKTSIRKSGLS